MKKKCWRESGPVFSESMKSAYRINFFALGGDSIQSIRVSALAREGGVNLAVEDLFRYQTVYELARRAKADNGASVIIESRPPFSLISEEDRSHLPDDVEDAYPLTALQEGCCTTWS